MDTEPLGIILVEKGTKGDRLLFRFPHKLSQKSFALESKRKSPYSMLVAEDPENSTAGTKLGSHFMSFSSKVLSHICAVKSELCGKKFELKVNDIRFVGHPILLASQDGKIGCRQERNPSSMILFNVVFALKYQVENSKDSPFERMLAECQLSKELKTILESLKFDGRVHVRINGWVLVSFCLPQKAYSLHFPHLSIEPRDLAQCIAALRPYHTILLLVEKDDLLTQLPLDSSPALKRLIGILNPTRNMQNLAADADLALDHVLELCGHLVYWAFGTPIFPLCDSNTYLIAPFAPIAMSFGLSEKFSEQFPGYSFARVLSEYALPVSIGGKRTPFQTLEEETEMLEIILWLLKHRVLMQLHTYVAMVVPQDSGSRRKKRDSVESCSMGTSDSDLLSNDSDDRSASPMDSLVHDLLPASLTPHERGSIMKVPRASDLDDLRLFTKLLPFFRGGHPLEEIMFRENIRRSQLLQLLDKFKSVLVIFQHEDTATTMFYRNCINPRELL